MDKATFESLFLPCQGALERLVRWRISNAADANDVLQDTLLLAYRNRDKLNAADKFKPWLLQIARNQCNEYYRRNARQDEMPLFEDIAVGLISQSSERSLMVRDILNRLPPASGEVLKLSYFDDLQQTEIAKLLGIPVGTVKSRLHTAKKQFRKAYQPKGETDMKQLPKILPEYKITPSDKPPFEVVWEEIMGWFAVPRLGEKCSWAIYDIPSRERKEQYSIESIGRAAVHGLEGVELIAKETTAQGRRGTDRSFIAQLTDTHCRILAEAHTANGVKQLYTFLDGDDFLPNWGFGEDNCGNSVHPVPQGMITRSGNVITCPQIPSALDVVGRYTVDINNKSYDTILVVDIENYNGGVLSETYLDKTGRTVLWRRYNRDDWHIDCYGESWSKRLPKNERLTLAGTTYVHWYDCITDHIL